MKRQPVMRKALNRRPKPRRVAEGRAAYARPGGEVILYCATDGVIRLDVRLDRDSLWLTQKQMSELFATERSVITKHLRNIFEEHELARDQVCATFAHTAGDGKKYQVDHYNLDAIISVGYRVNSKRGTHFRIWATSVLRDHVIKGYTVNERRLRELNKAVRLIADVAARRSLTGGEATELLHVVADYSRALDLLDDYDHQRLTTVRTTTDTALPVTYEEAVTAIKSLRKKFKAPPLFGLEKDSGLQSSLAAIMQSVGGCEAYPSLEEKAAHLLYFLVKNHPFVDGNKRIAAALFLWFLEKNRMLYRPDGTKRIADNALVSMTLLIAESRPTEKDVLARVLVSLIDQRNV